MNIITSILKSWEHRHLTLKGKITILKSLVVPHILQLASVLPLSKKILCELERMLYDFAWENKRHLISKDTLILTYELGDFKMVSVKCLVDTVKIMFVKRLCNGVDAKWKVVAQELMGIHLNNICERRLIQSMKQNIKTEFYLDLLTTWFHFLTPTILTLDKLLIENIFNNPMFLIAGEVITQKRYQWEVSGIVKVSDLFDSNSKTFKTKVQLEEYFGTAIPDMTHNQIISSVASCLKKLPEIKPGNVPSNIMNASKQCLKDISKIQSSQVYSYCIARSISTPVSQNKWIENYPFLETINWKDVYQLRFKILLDTYIITLQHKILHRVFACNYKLYIWKIKESPECCFCSNFSDNLKHFFYYCPITKQFWDSLKTWLTVLVPFKIELTVLEVLLGVVNIDRKYYSVVNYVILIGKYFICKSKKNNKYLFFQNFLKSLKYKINLELGAYISQDRTATFKDRYGVLHEFLEEQII